MRRVFFCILHCPHHTLSMSQPAYSGSPLVCLGRFLGLLWVLWGQFRLISGLTPDFTCFQCPQLFPKSTAPGQLRGKFSVPLAAGATYSILWSHSPWCEQLWFFVLPLLVGLPPTSAPYPDKKGWKWQLMRAYLLLQPGERKGYIRHNLDVLWWKESYDQARQHIKKQRHYFANKGPSGQGYGFSSGHAWMWELDCEESWVLKNWCFWTVLLEKTLESPLESKEIQWVLPKGDQFWVFIGRTDAEAETPILWPPHAKSWLIGKAPDAGCDWGQEEKRTTENEMVGWHHQLDGHEFE